jgi:hypothetical protein
MADAGDQSQKYDQAFFLTLAAKGKDTWNAWRRDPVNKDVPVTFAGIDFSQTPWEAIDFSGFEFGDHADFSQCKWRGGLGDVDDQEFAPGRACFTGADFGDHANFDGAAFDDNARFNGATFGKRASFLGATFGWFATFTGSTFGRLAEFTGAAFGIWTKFTEATFDDNVTFSHVTFDENATFTDAVFVDEADFTGAAFGPFTNFDNTVFKGQVRFLGRTEEQWTRDVEAFSSEMDEEAFMALKQRAEEYWERQSSGPDRCLEISFASARFYGEAIFSGRSFEERADFTGARFYSPPDFDGALNVGRIDFTGAHIGFVPPGDLLHWTGDSRIPIRLRTFRKIAEETKNHDLERDLYIEERKAERGVYLHQLLGLDELKKILEDIIRFPAD